MLDASWDGMSSAANQVGVAPVVAHDFMTREYIAKACLPKHLRRQEEGYVFMYVSNENPTLVDVYFDDVTMTYTPGNVIQYNACLPKLLRRQEYYPFGLQTSNSWTRTNTSNNYLYNEGTELNNTIGIYETLFRRYDATLGRFMQIDPLAAMDYSTSPFAYARNNPAVFNDPLGLLVDVTGYSDYQLRAMYRANRGNYGNFGDWAKDNLDFSGASSRIVDDGNGNFFGVNASGGFGRFVLANSYEVGYYTKVSTDGEKTWTNQRWTDVVGYDVYVWQAFEQQLNSDGPYPGWTHASIIRQAFGGILPDEYVNWIIAGSRNADRYQGAQESYMHAMSMVGQDKLEAAIQTFSYVSDQLDEFNTQMNSGNMQGAYEALGMAMHPLMDMYSPYHEGWQEWNPSNIFGAVVHVIGESFTTSGSQQAVSTISTFYNYAQWNWIGPR